MVELHYSPEQRDQALGYFYEHGFTHYTGSLAIQGAWIATQERVAYVLVESSEVEELERACVPLKQFGQVIYRAVTDVQQI
jgi:hypothetical protein